MRWRDGRVRSQLARKRLQQSGHTRAAEDREWGGVRAATPREQRAGGMAVLKVGGIKELEQNL